MPQTTANTVDHPPVDVVLDAIMTSAIHSLSAIARLCEESANHPTILKVIEEVQEHVKEYCDAITNSVDTALVGFDSSANAITLCELLRAEDTSADNIEDLIETLRVDMRSRCEDSTATKEKFGDIHKGVVRIATHILPKTVKEGIKLTWHTHLRSHMGGKSDGEQEVGNDDGLSEVASHLSNLIKSIDMFITWWKTIEKAMLAFARNVDRHAIVNAIMHKTWNDTKASYLGYATEIVKLQQYYPHVLEAPKPDVSTPVAHGSRHRTAVRSYASHIKGRFVTKALDLVVGLQINHTFENSINIVDPPPLSDVFDSIVNPPPLSDVLDSIVTGTIQSLGAIIIWCGVRTNHPAVAEVLGDIRQRGEEYCAAINQTVDTVQAGFNLSTNAITLCNFLLDPNTAPDIIQGLVDSMKCDSEGYCKISRNILEQFRLVCQGFNEIASKLAAEETINSQWIVHLPPLNADIFGRKSDEAREIGFEDAINGLKEMVAHLVKLTENIGKFVDCWVMVKAALLRLERNADALKAGGRLRIQDMRKAWTNINNDFMRCKKKIVELQPHYPSSMLEAPGNVIAVMDPPDVSDVLVSVVAGAIQSFGAIIPWCGVITKHPDVLKVLCEIRGRGGDYCDAIRDSVDAAQAGWKFSDDAIAFCGLLLDRSSGNDVKRSIEGMKVTAANCHKCSKVTQEKFSKVRQGIFEITNKLPNKVGEGITDSQYIIHLPPINDAIFSRKNDQIREVGYEEVIKGLKEVATHLANLTKSIDAVIEWWVKMETKLFGLQNKAEELKAVDQRGIKDMQKRWTRVNDDFLQYKIEITKLRDRYPRIALEGSEIGV